MRKLYAFWRSLYSDNLQSTPLLPSKSKGESVRRQKTIATMPMCLRREVDNKSVTSWDEVVVGEYWSQEGVIAMFSYSRVVCDIKSFMRLFLSYSFYSRYAVKDPFILRLYISIKVYTNHILLYFIAMRTFIYLFIWITQAFNYYFRTKYIYSLFQLCFLFNFLYSCCLILLVSLISCCTIRLYVNWFLCTAS